jgi:competence protein ComFC
MTFVPLHKKRKRKRGYNQSELLAGGLSGLIGIESKPLLEKTKNHKKNLARLDKEQRREEIRDTFSFAGEKESVSGKTVLLIDDVLTTGATANECAKVLVNAGAREVIVLTFSSVEYKVNEA